MKYFVERSGLPVAEVATRDEAQELYDSFLRETQDWRANAAVWSADSRQQYDDYVAHRVQLVCTGVTRLYWPEVHRREAADGVEA